MEFTVATSRERANALVLAFGLGLLLAWGFLGTARTFLEWGAGIAGVSPGPWAQRLAFPLLAGFFYLSLPGRTRSASIQRPDLSRAVLISLVPLAIAWAYGRLRGFPGWTETLQSPQGTLELFWILVAIPLGEEWLFRGWVFGLSERLWPGRWATATNPLPLSLWVAAIAFSLWHVQNLGADAPGWVAFQCAYALLAGLWLGYLRFLTGQIFPCLVAHTLLNAAAHGIS